MGQYDLRLDIPVRAIMNDNLRHRIEHGASFLEAKKDYFGEPWAKQAGIDPYAYTTDDQVRAVSLLYCLIVVPRELLKLAPNHELYRRLDALNVDRHFNVKRPVPIDSYRLITSLRHAVAHGLFSIQQSNQETQYTFWTERNPLFEAEITNSRLTEFLNEVGIPLADAVVRIKTKSPT
ncbi:MAG: hypothetical protein NT031_06500 [Planctomycetota bacterium]|nr:hypothetical protein [Planctomycetota bacterium]